MLYISFYLRITNVILGRIMKYTFPALIAILLMITSVPAIGISQIQALGVHDVGIAKVFIDYGVTWGQSCEINVTLANYGSYDEISNLTVYANTTGLSYGTVISTANNVSLTVGNSTTISVFWNGKNVPRGPHVITAYVAPVSNETNITNNIYVAGTIRVTKPYDIDGDGNINVIDLICVAISLGKSPPYGFNYPIPRPDANGDGKVNVLDLILVCRNLGM